MLPGQHTHFSPPVSGHLRALSVSRILLSAHACAMIKGRHPRQKPLPRASPRAPAVIQREILYTPTQAGPLEYSRRTLTPRGPARRGERPVASQPASQPSIPESVTILEGPAAGFQVSIVRCKKGGRQTHWLPSLRRPLISGQKERRVTSVNSLVLGMRVVDGGGTLCGCARGRSGAWRKHDGECYLRRDVKTPEPRGNHESL